MDITAFKVALEAARRIEVEVGGAKFRLRIPTDHAWRVALEAHRDESGRFQGTLAMRAVLDGALDGWDGVTQADVLPDAGTDPLPFSAEARTMLLDARQDIADTLAAEVATRVATRREAREAARKN